MAKKFTDAKLESALRASGGIMSVAAQALHDATGIKISRQAIRERVQRSPRLRRAIEEAEEQTLDLAENVVIKHLHNGDLNAARFYLETKGKWRGFSRRVFQLLSADPRKMSDDELNRSLKELEAVALTIDAKPVEPPRALPAPPKKRPRD